MRKKSGASHHPASPKSLDGAQKPRLGRTLVAMCAPVGGVSMVGVLMSVALRVPKTTLVILSCASGGNQS